MKISKEKQQQLILVGMVTVVISVALWYLVISPTSRKVVELDTKIKKMGDDLKTAQETVGTAKDAKEKLDSETQRLKTMEDTMVPPVNTYSVFLGSMNSFKLSYQPNVDVGSISRELLGELAMYPAGFPYKTAGFTIRGSGYYHTLGQFIADWENKNPYGVVQKLNLRPGGTEGAENSEKLAFDVELVTLINGTAP